MRILVLCLAATAAFAQTDTSTYQPISGTGRVEWAIMSVISLPSFGAGFISSAWGTGFDRPKEYGVSLEGYGDRFGMRFAGVSLSNAMEASIGAPLGEDPRYFRDVGQPFSHRVWNVVKMTVMAHNANGDIVPAYARYAAISGSNFLSNSFRADSEANAKSATIRIGLGFLGRMSSNAYIEFWPDVRRHVFKSDH